MIKLAEIIITSDLAKRPLRGQVCGLEEMLAAECAREAAGADGAILVTACKLALAVALAGTAAISFIDNDRDSMPCGWICVEGLLKHRLSGRGTIGQGRDSIVIQALDAHLFEEPGRYFEWMRIPGISVKEAYVVPLLDSKRRPLGNMWVMHHDDERGFDAEDAMVLDRLAAWAAGAIDAGHGTLPVREQTDLC